MDTPTDRLDVFLVVDALDDGPDFTRGLIVGLLRGAGITVRAIAATPTEHEEADPSATPAADAPEEPAPAVVESSEPFSVEVEDVAPDPELLARIERELVPAVDRPLLDDRPRLDHEAIRARAVQGL